MAYACCLTRIKPTLIGLYFTQQSISSTFGWISTPKIPRKAKLERNFIQFLPNKKFLSKNLNFIPLIQKIDCAQLDWIEQRQELSHIRAHQKLTHQINEDYSLNGRRWGWMYFIQAILLFPIFRFVIVTGHIKPLKRPL